ncbi:MAG TPA: 5'/3'-nucleotidase SurE [Kofleriaceae bacterium]|nr:5'/3'-nucleotidase SurE [Kofleriaceae bacterium]
MAERPLILLTNDDGVTAPYIEALAAALEPELEALVVAPERQRSAASHAITLHKPLRAREVAPGRWSLSGTPVDCVYVGLLRLASRRPALIVSGPNDGYNLGSDVFYSGTVAGAVEGALRGLPGIALSIAPRATHVPEAIAFAAAFVRAAVGQAAKGEVLNVNIPGAGETTYAWTHLGRRHYADDVHERTDPGGRPYYWIGGGSRGHDDIPGSDCNATADGIVSVTPLRLDLNHLERVKTPLFTVPGYPVVDFRA